MNALIQNILQKLGAGVNVVLPNATKNVVITQAVSGSYASGNVVGGLLTVTGAARVAGGSGLIQSVTLQIAGAQTTQFDVVYFNAAPAAGSTYADKNNPAISVSELNKVIGVAHLTDYTQIGANTVYQAQSLAIPFAPVSGQDIYAIVIARGALTLAAGDASFNTRILQD